MEVTKSLTVRAYEKWGVSSVAVSPDGKSFVTGGGAVKKWSIRGELLADLNDGKVKGLIFAVFAEAFAPGGKLLATGAWENEIKIWDLSANNVRALLRGHKSSVYSVAASRKGGLLASGSHDKTVRLWNLEKSMLIHTLRGHRAAVGTVAFSSDGSTVASGSYDTTVRLWEVSTGRERAVLTGHKGVVKSVQFSPDNKLLASGSNDQEIRFWQLATNTERGTLKVRSGAVNSICFSPDGKTLAAACGGPEEGYDPPGYVELWDVPSMQYLTRFLAHKSFVTSVVFFPSGGALITGGDDGTASIWKIKR
jgi:WD40 repeat protein